MNSAAILSTCTDAWKQANLSGCKPLGLDAATWIAAISALVTATFFIVRQILRWRKAHKASVGFIGRTGLRSRFRNLCRYIKPILDDNYRIFSQFGPNSGRGDGLPKNIRHNLGVWYQLRPQIVENNIKIKEAISINASAIPLRYKSIFTSLIDHIDAFGAHIKDGEADYQDHQFPKKISSIVARHA